MKNNCSNPKIALVLAALLVMSVIGTTAIPAQAQSDQPPTQAAVHIVQRGETLISIAQRYGSTVDAVTHTNGIPDPRQIYVGQRVVIPGNHTDTGMTETMPYIFQEGDTLASIARRYGTTWQILAQLNDLLAPNVIYTGHIIQVPVPVVGNPVDMTGETDTSHLPYAPTSTGATYIVRPDDTLFRIALSYDISPWTLAAASHVANPALIYPGQELAAPAAGNSLLPRPFSSVDVQPLPVAQGTAMIVAVHTTEPVTLTGKLFEQQIYFAEEDGVYYGMLGVHVFTEPGFYKLELTAIDGQEHSTVIDTGVVVKAVRFNYERIDVPASRTNLLDPDAIARDRERLDTARYTFSTERLWTTPFQRPCIGSISAYFGAHRSYNGGPYTSYHSGADFRTYGGTPVHAPAAGIVVLAEPLSLWGNAVVLDHGWGVLTGYAHLSTIEVQVGQRVAQGELIAKVGNTGLSTGSHLHWEMWVGGNSVNALQWLEESYPWPKTEWMGIGG